MSNEATESQPLIPKEKSDGDVEVGDKKKSSTTTESGPTVLEDVIDILNLAVPIFITSFSWVGVSANRDDCFVG